MMTRLLFISTVHLLSCCCIGQTFKQDISINTQKKLQAFTTAMSEAELKSDLKSYISYYDEAAISMPEYQLTLTGKTQIENFYQQIFLRQKITSLQKKAVEFIQMDSTIVELGNFEKSYKITGGGDSIYTQHGKYWHVWKLNSNGFFLLTGESFGYYHPVENPDLLIVDFKKKQPGEAELLQQRDIPFELKAYNALMEKGVRNRDGILRSQFFTDDGSFMPFAESNVVGMAEIKPYLLQYSSRGMVTIDSIQCYTYHYEYHGDYILEYPFFKVKWTSNGYSGGTEGKSIRIWKRQADHSLRLFREISTHNHLL